MAARPVPDDPISEVNTTPLIDVMLVLLVMFIITIPIQTHKVPIDLPTGPPPIDIQRDRNKLKVTEAGAMMWNGEQVSLEQLRIILDRVAAMREQPELHFVPHPDARYVAVGDALATIKRANGPLMGFGGNERYRDF